MKVQRVELIGKAQELITDAIYLLEVALSEDANAKAYLLDKLRIMVNEEHGFLSNELNLSKLIDKYIDEKEKIFIGEDISDILYNNNSDW